MSLFIYFLFFFYMNLFYNSFLQNLPLIFCVDVDDEQSRGSSEQGHWKCCLSIFCVYDSLFFCWYFYFFFFFGCYCPSHFFDEIMMFDSFVKTMVMGTPQSFRLQGQNRKGYILMYGITKEGVNHVCEEGQTSKDGEEDAQETVDVAQDLMEKF